MKAKLLLFVLLVSKLTYSQTTFDITHDSLKHVKLGKYWKSYYNGTSTFFNTNQTLFNFNKQVTAPLFKINSDSVPTWPDVRSYIATHANNYSLPIASGSVLGGVKVGSGLSIDGLGVLSASGTSADSLIFKTNYQSKLDTIKLHNQIVLKQNQINGTGFVKASSTTISYDNSTYISSTDTANTTRSGSMSKYDYIIMQYNTPAKNLTFSGSIDLTNHKSSNYNDYTIAGPLSVTIASNPVDGSVAGIAMIADGTNAPTFTGLYLASGAWVNTASTRNLVTFWRLGNHTYFSISQPVIQ